MPYLGRRFLAFPSNASRPVAGGSENGGEPCGTRGQLVLFRCLVSPPALAAAASVDPVAVEVRLATVASISPCGYLLVQISN